MCPFLPLSLSLLPHPLSPSDATQTLPQRTPCPFYIKRPTRWPLGDERGNRCVAAEETDHHGERGHFWVALRSVSVLILVAALSRDVHLPSCANPLRTLLLTPLSLPPSPVSLPLASCLSAWSTTARARRLRQPCLQPLLPPLPLSVFFVRDSAVGVTFA